MFFEEYERICLLGEGAFAKVFKVRHAQLGYIRALKVSDHYIEDENDSAWQTFLAECKVLLRIGNGSHPNIVKIFQPRLINNHAVVEMDCVEGDTLHKFIQQNKFIPIEEFFQFAKQIISALTYCHVDVYKFMMNPTEDHLETKDIDPNNGRKFILSPEKEAELIKKYSVVHNDLHSGNIIKRDYDGQYILLDFGLAIQNSHCVKSSSRFDGAIEYCSPEKLENGTISTQSDIYALGILLYEILTGRVPFPYSNGDGSTPESARSRVYQQHLQETPPSIFEFRKQAFEATHPGETYTQDYPEQLEAIIMKCLAKKPKERFKNAKELSAAFNKLMENNSSNSSMRDLNKIKEEMAELRSQLQNENEEKLESRDKCQATWEECNDELRKKSKKRLQLYILWIAGIIIGCAIIVCINTYNNNIRLNEPPKEDTAIAKTSVNQSQPSDTLKRKCSTLPKSINNNSSNNTKKDKSIINEKPLENSSNSSTSLSIPLGIQEALNMLTDGNISREIRLNSIPEIMRKFFEHGAKICTVSDSDLILDNENAEDFLRRIVLSQRISRIIITGSEKQNKITELRIKEIHK